MFAFFLSLFNAGRSFPLSLLSWLEKVKRHLAADSCFTSHKVFLVIFLPHFFLIFPNVPLRHQCQTVILSGILNTSLLPICAKFLDISYFSVKFFRYYLLQQLHILHLCSSFRYIRDIIIIPHLFIYWNLTLADV